MALSEIYDGLFEDLQELHHETPNDAHAAQVLICTIGTILAVGLEVERIANALEAIEEKLGPAKPVPTTEV